MPQIRFRDNGSVLRTAARIRLRDAGNVLRTLQRIRMRDAANVLRTVYTYFTVSIPVSTNKTGSGAASSGTVTSDLITAVITGGTAPFTYAWNYESGSLAISIDSPTSSATTFTAEPTDGPPETAFFSVSVTDANGFTARSASIQVQLRWIDTR